MSENIPITKIVDFAAGHLSREESLALLERIEQDREASRSLDLIASMMDLVEREGETLFAERESSRTSLVSRLARFVGETLLPRFHDHPVLSGAAVFVVVLAALMLMVPPASPYGTLASLADFDFGATVRGIELEDLTVAFNLYQRGDYGQSISLFERHIRAYPRGRMVEYAHYAAGAAYLRWSEWRLGSFFIGFDRDRVERGVEHLEQAIQLSESPRLLEDSRWLLAKGSLMLFRSEAAIDHLRRIEGTGGRRKGEAIEMIRQLQALSDGE